MVKATKDKLEEQKAKKTCFGTKEWSDNSGICNGCSLKEACGKIQAKRQGA